MELLVWLLLKVVWILKGLAVLSLRQGDMCGRVHLRAQREQELSVLLEGDSVGYRQRGMMKQRLRLGFMRVLVHLCNGR